MVNTTNLIVSQQCTTFATVHDVDPIPVAYSSSAHMRPDRIEVVYAKYGAQPWELSEVHVFGFRILGDGSTGSRARNRYDDVTDAPEWVREFVHAHVPQEG